MEDPKEIIDMAQMEMQDSLKHLEEELKTYRIGKASPSILSSVMFSYYGAMTPLPQVSSVTTPDAKTIIVQPWEKKLLSAIEKAIIDANLGLTPQNNGEHIFITVPALTEERRKDLVKRCKAEGEKAKISIRNARRDALESLKKALKDGLSEDLEKDAEGDVQEIVDNFTKKIDEIIAVKEKEILTV